jgi:hypothetical protein
MLGAAAQAVFPRPLLVELGDLDPGRYEALTERTATLREFPEALMRELLGASVTDLSLIREVVDSIGATNIHVIAPFVRTAQDTRVVRAALELVGLTPEAGGPHTFVFSELRNPSELFYDPQFVEEQDGIILRAGRFYKAMLRQGAGLPTATGAADAASNPAPSAAFVQALLRVTRAFERSGGTILAEVESAADLDELWFYLELGVDGFVARLEDAEACARALSELERKRESTGGRRGKLR